MSWSSTKWGHVVQTRKKHPNSSAEPLLGTIDDAMAILGQGRNGIYAAMNAGALVKVKFGGRTMITMASIRNVAKNGFRKEAA